jgi:hypothetical protein
MDQEGPTTMSNIDEYTSALAASGESAGQTRALKG